MFPFFLGYPREKRKMSAHFKGIYWAPTVGQAREANIPMLLSLKLENYLRALF